jgi:hypothetical protein
MRIVALVLGMALVVAPVAVPSVQAQTVALHHGSVDPVTTGWTVFSDAGASSGPVLDGGVPAWSLHNRAYFQLLSATAQGQLATQGWILTVIARIVDPSVTETTTRTSFYLSRGWTLRFGCRADGRPYVMLLSAEPYSVPTGPEYTLTGDPQAYHRYDLVCPPSSNLASLYVDGVLRIANHQGYIHAQQPGSFAFGSSDPVGQARFHHVEVRVGSELPVPAEAGSWGALKAHYRD